VACRWVLDSGIFRGRVFVRRLVVCAWLVGVVLAAACDDATGPKSVQHVATIMNIKVPDRAAAADTVRVAFNYVTQFCDTGTVLQVRGTPDGTRFTVTSWSTDLPCAVPLSVFNPQLPSVVYVMSPPKGAPLRLLFSEPGGADSVRVVAP
jgi:hypothetical protein